MPLHEEGAKLLLEGTKILEKIDDDQFDMGCWGRDLLEVGGVGEPPIVTSCGTTHCLLGWISTIPGVLEKFGIRLVPQGWAVSNVYSDAPKLCRDHSWRNAEDAWLSPDAVITALTGIDWSDGHPNNRHTHHLFHEPGDRGEVIERTIKFVRERFPHLLEKPKKAAKNKEKTKCPSRKKARS